MASTIFTLAVLEHFVQVVALPFIDGIFSYFLENEWMIDLLRWEWQCRVPVPKRQMLMPAESNRG